MESNEADYRMTLYVAGSSPRSVRAIRNIRELCEERLKGRYELDVVDLYQQPGRASEAQIAAAPTLIKALPLPMCRLVGDLADTDSVLIGLGLKLLEK
jgi:circadian clock protein KaiB